MHKHPPTLSAAPRSDAVWARHGTRQHMIQFGLVTVLCGTLAGFTSYGLISGGFSNDEATLNIGVILTVVSSALTLAAVAALVTLPKRKHSMPAIAVDANGVWWVHRDLSLLTTWQDLVGVGTSYKVPPRARAQAESAPFRQAYAFEAYLCDAALDGHPHASVLRRWLVTEEPPHPDLPRQRLRCLMPVAGAREQLHRVVGHHAPQLWVEEHERHWNSMLGA